MFKNLGMSIRLYADDAVIYCRNHDSYFVHARLEQLVLHVMNSITIITLRLDNTSQRPICSTPLYP